MSTRYQEQVAAVEASMRDLDKAAREQLQGYRDKIALLGEYEAAYIEHAFESLAAKVPPKREQAVLELLRLHVDEFGEKRRADVESWLDAFRKRFEGFSDT